LIERRGRLAAAGFTLVFRGCREDGSGLAFSHRGYAGSPPDGTPSKLCATLDCFEQIAHERTSSFPLLIPRCVVRHRRLGANLGLRAGAARHLRHVGRSTGRSTGRVQAVPGRLSSVCKGALAGRLQGQLRHLLKALPAKIAGYVTGSIDERGIDHEG